MLTKHEDHVCKDCKEKFQSSMELLKHVAKHHVSKRDELKDMKDQCEEVVQNEGNQEMAEIEDSEEVERMKINKNSEKWTMKKNTRVLSSVSLSSSMNFFKKVIYIR